MSNKKLFSLIDGRSVHTSPETKVIPKKEFSVLAEAHNVLEQIKYDAEHYRKQIAHECEILKDQAQKVGFEEGFNQWIEQVAHLENQLSQVRMDVEKILVPVALKAAKKIVGRELELSEDTIADIVGNSLKAVSTHKRIVIWVNKKDLAALERNRSKLRERFEGLESMAIRERPDISPGGCVIETEGGIINAQFENQWKALENALEVILSKKNLSHGH